jgi:hypothetical protein
VRRAVAVLAAGLGALLPSFARAAAPEPAAPKPAAPEAAAQPPAAPEAATPEPAAPEPEDGLRVRPTLEVEAALATQRLVADLGATRTEATRALWATRLAAGVDVRLPAALLPVGRLRVLGSVGLGYVYETGAWPVHVGAAALWQAPVSPRWSFPLGVSARVVIDTQAPQRSDLELGLPLGVRCGRVELVYNPAVVIPFGAEVRPLLGGERRLGAKPGIAPLGLVLRVVL